MDFPATERGHVSVDPADVLAIQALVSAYYLRVDRPGEELAADLFAPDGVLVLGPTQVVGRIAIAAYFAERTRAQAESGRITRHLSSDVELKRLDDNRVAGRSITVVFAGSGELPLTAGAPSTIGDFDDVFVRTELGWLFESRRASIIFTGPGAADFAKKT